MKVGSDIKFAEIRAVVTRADGTCEDLGQIAVFRRSFIRRALDALRHRLNHKE